jgi:hypothetical protein
VNDRCKGVALLQSLRAEHLSEVVAEGRDVGRAAREEDAADFVWGDVCRASEQFQQSVFSWPDFRKVLTASSPAARFPARWR